MRMAVVVPAYNEAETLGACLAAIQQAIAQLPPAVSEVKVLVVLDSCDDQSVEIVQQAGIDYLCCEVRCVGKARDLGGARHDCQRCRLDCLYRCRYPG